MPLPQPTMKKPKRIKFQYTAAFWLRRFKKMEAKFFGDWQDFNLSE